ncbi:MAG TPA: hypothetical protein VGF94_09885 [Kofleriaceae bacterium]
MQFYRLALCASLVAACGDSSSSSIPSQCNPLGGEGCLLPWPSATYEVADATSATGYRLAIPDNAMPVNVDGILVDPSKVNRWDGFSPTGFLLAAFPNGVSATNLPPFSDPDQSLAAGSPIILLDMDTGERAPFFAEVDQNVSDPAKADLIIRPLARLHTGAHYAVAIRNTVVDPSGAALPVPAAFAAARDGKGFDHPRFADLAKREQDVFTALATAGVDKSELVVAWDYTTASDAFLTNDLTTMMAAAVPAIGDTGANLTFSATAQPAIPNIYASYVGTFKSPNFLTDGENNDSIINRDASGNPQLMGMRDANFAALIPQCVTTQTLPRPTIIFGHGLFGSAKDYLSNSFVQMLSEQLCVVILAGDFIGLTSRQVPLAPLAVNDMNLAPDISEKLGQSVIDFVALENITRGPMTSSPEFMVNGQSVIDPAHTFYVGGSLGGIMGNTIMAYDPNLVRGVLAVPGGDWSLLFERSNAWADLIGAAQGAYPDLAYYQLNLAMLGMAMEPYDPITTAAHVLADTRPGVPPKSILMWYSIGDCLVTNISTEVVARTMGISVLAPSVKSPWMLPPQPGPLANGVNVFDAHPTPLPPITNVPPAVDNGTHSGINQEPAALRLAQSFLLDDTIVPQCMLGSAAAPCDCGTGACN